MFSTEERKGEVHYLEMENRSKGTVVNEREELQAEVIVPDAESHLPAEHPGSLCYNLPDKHNDIKRL